MMGKKSVPPADPMVHESGLTYWQAHKLSADERRSRGINEWYNTIAAQRTAANRRTKSSERMRAVRIPREEPNGTIPRVDVVQALKAVDRGFAAEQVGRVAVDESPDRFLELVAIYLQQRALTAEDWAERSRLLGNAQAFTELRMLYEQTRSHAEKNGRRE
jgi:hypothetical protein